MNPLEGTLRAQLLDRFGLCVIISRDSENEERNKTEDIKRRVEIISRRMEFERDPAAFRARFAAATDALACSVSEARRILPEVQADDIMVQTTAAVAASAHCTGHRAEIALIEAARACAALSGRRKISLNDLKAVSAFALVHRARPESGKSQSDEEHNTPLAAGIDLARRTLVTHRMKYPDMPSTMVLITDGRATFSGIPGMDPFAAALRAADHFARSGFGSIILDTENGSVRFHMCAALNELLGGTLLSLDDLESEGITAAIDAHKLRR